MRSVFRPLPLVLAAFALGLSSRAAAQSTPAKNSPFLPAPGSAVAAPTNSSETLQFSGVSVDGPKTFVSLLDTQTKKSRWIAVGSTIEGLNVVSYDAQRDQVVVRIGGADKTLSLRKSSGVTASANLNYTPLVASFALPASATGAPAIPAPTMGTPVPPPTTPTAKAEQEARMLVSDLLDIGIIQRKAYEEAQKKAELDKKKS